MKKLEYGNSARRDLRTYLVLGFGVFFTWAGATVAPSTNCDESGRECAPWLVPIAFCMGLLATAAGLGLWAANRRWGSRLDLDQRRLSWWDTAKSAETHAIALDDVSRIKVQHFSEGDDKLFLYDRDGALIRFPDERAVPYDAERWARDLAVHCPHIVVEIEEK